MHTEARVRRWVSSSVAFHFTFEIGSLTNLELTEFTELASQWAPAFPALKLQTNVIGQGFQAWTTSTLLIEPSFQSQELFSQIPKVCGEKA